MTIISDNPFTADSDDVLRSIMTIDETLFKRLMEISNSKVDYEVAAKILVTITMERKLDKMPTPARADKTVGLKSGIAEYFKVRYSTTKGSDIEEITGSIIVGDRELRCDYSVVRVIKALIKTGRSKNVKVSNATTEMIRQLTSAVAASDYLTTSGMCDELKPTGYYEKELVRAIKEVSNGEVRKSEKKD